MIQGTTNVVATWHLVTVEKVFHSIGCDIKIIQGNVVATWHRVTVDNGVWWYNTVIFQSSKVWPEAPMLLPPDTGHCDLPRLAHHARELTSSPLLRPDIPSTRHRWKVNIRNQPKAWKEWIRHVFQSNRINIEHKYFLKNQQNACQYTITWKRGDCLLHPPEWQWPPPKSATGPDIPFTTKAAVADITLPWKVLTMLLNMGSVRKNASAVMTIFLDSQWESVMFWFCTSAFVTIRHPLSSQWFLS